MTNSYIVMRQKIYLFRNGGPLLRIPKYYCPHKQYKNVAILYCDRV
uniref:Uncharacterized protein n=1 Tax=viral metagenome TaxID=1070528 RepID=A0A6C0DNT2_9ZZZZ